MPDNQELITNNPRAVRASPAENFGKYERRDDCCIRFYDKTRGAGAQFTPGDFFVRDRARIRSEAGGRIADLAEITPFGDLLGDEVLIKQRHDANREIARDPAADLKEADG